MRTLDGEHIGANRIKLGFGKSMHTNCVWVDGVSGKLSRIILEMDDERITGEAVLPVFYSLFYLFPFLIVIFYFLQRAWPKSTSVLTSGSSDLWLMSSLIEVVGTLLSFMSRYMFCQFFKLSFYMYVLHVLQQLIQEHDHLGNEAIPIFVVLVFILVLRAGYT